jgi:hypothetical protein
LLFQNPPRILPNTLITAGQLEPQGLAANAADLVAGNSDPSIQFHSSAYCSLPARRGCRKHGRREC